MSLIMGILRIPRNESETNIVYRLFIQDNQLSHPSIKYSN